MNSLVFAAASIKLKSLFMRAYWEVNFDYPLSVFGKIENPWIHKIVLLTYTLNSKKLSRQKFYNHLVYEFTAHYAYYA